MSYESYASGCVFVLRWSNVGPTDIPRLCDDLEAAAGAAGSAVFCINVIPEHTALPSKETRHFIVQSWGKLMKHVRVSYVVVEGNSIASALQRSVISAIRALLRRGDSMVASRTVLSALQSVSAEAAITPEDVLAELRARQIVVES